jgi:aminodeoxyfutalosine synthase
MTAASLAGTARKAAAGAAISEDDARQLMATTDLVTVGMISTDARRVRVGDRVTYVRVAEISAELAAAIPASLALPSARSLSASAGPGAESKDAAAGTASAWPPAGAREIRITGAPASLGDVVASARAVALSLGGEANAGTGASAGADTGAGAAASANALRIPLTAFSLADLWVLASGDAVKLREIADGLRDAGVIAIAEVPIDDFASPEAVATAIEVVTSAGLLAPVATWRDAPADPIASLMALHALQERTHAFRAFAPLPRHQSAAMPSTGYEDVKIVAVARTVLHNIDHIQVDWASHGPKLAQVALLFGASDLDRVAASDDAPLGHRRAPLEDVQRNIKSAFLDPVERDGRFEQVRR